MEVVIMLRNNVEQLLKDAVRRHLSDEELGIYNEDAVDEVAGARMKAHLSRCWICDRRLSMMQEMLEAYSKEPVTDEDIALIEHLLHRKPEEPPVPRGWLADFAAWWQQQRIRPALVGAYSAPVRSQPQDGQTEDGALRWRVVEDEWGDLVVRFGSHRMELEGVNFVLKAGPIQKEVVLEAVTDDQVGAEVIFTREERTEMPEDIQLTVDILNDD
jgi:hypothetical protein